VREIMAQLGFRTVEEMVGRTDRLEPRKAVDHWKAKGLDFSATSSTSPTSGRKSAATARSKQDHGLDKSLDITTLLETSASRRSSAGEKVIAELPIRNVNRVVGTITGSESRRSGAPRACPRTPSLNFKGSAGQSFGAFMPRGMTFPSRATPTTTSARASPAARSSSPPPAGARSSPRRTSSSATSRSTAPSGEVYIRGMAGERFACATPASHAVVEAWATTAANT
jgi:glutamate synthase domain-containing protein 3